MQHKRTCASKSGFIRYPSAQNKLEVRLHVEDLMVFAGQRMRFNRWPTPEQSGLIRYLRFTCKRGGTSHTLLNTKGDIEQHASGKHRCTNKTSSRQKVTHIAENVSSASASHQNELQSGTHPTICCHPCCSTSSRC